MKRKELVDLLTLASRALSDNTLVPIHKCFMFNEGKLIAFNDNISISAPLNLGKDIVLHGKTMMGLLSNTQSEDVEITLEDDEAVIKGGRSTFKLPWQPVSDFPYEDPQGPWDVTIPFNFDFLTGIKACLKTSSRDLTKEAWCGVTIPPGKAVLYSSDGDAVSEYTLDGKLKSKDQYLLRNEFCEALIDLAISLDVTSGKLSINNQWVLAELGDVKLGGRMLEIASPVDFAGEIKRTVEVQPAFVPIPEGLLQALARARVVADSESARTTLTVEKGRLRLLTEASMGIVRDTLALPKHPEVTAHVSAELVERSLADATSMAIRDTYCAFKSDKLFVLAANME